MSLNVNCLCLSLNVSVRFHCRQVVPECREMSLFVSNVAKLSLNVSFPFFGGCWCRGLSPNVSFWILWRCWVSRFVAFSCLCVSLSLRVTTSLFLDSVCLCSMSLYVLIFLSCVFCWASQVVFNYVVLCVCWCLCLSLDAFCCLLGFAECILSICSVWLV